MQLTSVKHPHNTAVKPQMIGVVTLFIRTARPPTSVDLPSPTRWIHRRDEVVVGRRDDRMHGFAGEAEGP